MKTETTGQVWPTVERQDDYGKPVDVPVVSHLDARILRLIEAGGELRMSAMFHAPKRYGRHSCRTPHCRGGWAIVAAGKQGIALEKEVGMAEAAEMIYAESMFGHTRNMFWASTSDADALADIRRRAELDPLPEDEAVTL